MDNKVDVKELLDKEDSMTIESITQNYKAYIESTRNYFNELSIWFWEFLVGLAIAICCSVIDGSYELLVLCVPLEAFVIYVIYNFYQTQISDEVFDNILKCLKKKLEDAATSKLGLTSSDFIRTPVTLDVPRYNDCAGAVLSFKKGKDEKLRYSLHNMHLFFFTQKYLAMFNCAFDLKTGNILNEHTEEYFYHDVVSVGVKTLSGYSNLETLATGNSLNFTQNDSWKFFELRNSGGDLIRVPLLRSGDNLNIENPDNVVNSIRALLRDIK